MVQLVDATVKYGAGKVVSTQYGDRVNVVCVTQDNQEARIWGKPDDPELKALRKGQAVQLLDDGKSFKLATRKGVTETAGDREAQQQAVRTESAAASAKPTKWSDEHISQIRSECSYLAWMMEQCHRDIAVRFTPEGSRTPSISEDTIQKYACTLFIELRKQL